MQDVKRLTAQAQKTERTIARADEVLAQIQEAKELATMDATINLMDAQ